MLVPVLGCSFWGVLQDGPFCVFPTDYCVGEGETVFISVEYLPSEVGVHEACFIMVQVPIVAVLYVLRRGLAVRCKILTDRRLGDRSTLNHCGALVDVVTR